MEIEILQKRWHYSPIQKKINEPELRRGFMDFFRRIKLKCNSEMNQLLHLVSPHPSHLIRYVNHQKVAPA